MPLSGPVDKNGALRWFYESGNTVEQYCFATLSRPEDYQKLVLVHFKRNGVQYMKQLFLSGHVKGF